MIVHLSDNSSASQSGGMFVQMIAHLSDKSSASQSVSQLGENVRLDDCASFGQMGDKDLQWIEATKRGTV